MATFSGPNYVGEFDASRIIAKAKSGAHLGVGQASAFLAREIKIMLSKPGPGGGRVLGAVYKVKGALAKRIGTKQTVRPSAPGEPPRYRTRLLLNSIQYIFETPVLTRVGSHLMYAFWLEFGTIKMAARPFLRVALTLHKDEIGRIITSNLKGALKA